MFYVRHKNPNLSVTEWGKTWTKDGPFVSEAEAEIEIARCGYRAHGIPFEIIEEAISEEEHSGDTGEIGIERDSEEEHQEPGREAAHLLDPESGN